MAFNMKIKTKKPRINNHYRVPDNTCPQCLSTLKLDDKGHWSCSGDKLKIWEKDFEAYSKLSEIQQNEFLLKFDDVDLFLELFEKWNYTDNRGNRTNFCCSYSNSVFNLVLTQTLTIPDPLQIYHIEKSLKRPLTEEEKRGEKAIWSCGGQFYSSYKKGRKRIIINTVNIPEDV